MKKILTCIITLIIASCSSEDSGNQESELIAISRNYYSGSSQQPYYFHKLNFCNNKLMNIQEKNGDHTDFEYNHQNLVSKYQSFNANPDLQETRTYQYDERGRITAIDRKTQYQNQHYTTNFEFIYEPNRIMIFRNGEAVNELGLDKNYNIITNKLLTINLNYHTIFSYTNGNLMHFEPNTEVSPNLIPSTCTYSYTKHKNNFNYQKYLFGKEWKKNVCLDYFTGTNNITQLLDTTSDNAIAESLLTIGQTWHKNKYSYYFKKNGEILKEITETTLSFGPIVRTELTYEYK